MRRTIWGSSAVDCVTVLFVLFPVFVLIFICCCSRFIMSIVALTLEFEYFAAALKVLSYLPFPYLALSSLLIIPTPVRDAVYDFVAKRRYKWREKEDECLVLKEPELLERFIDREELLEQSHSDG